jgi:ribonuclease G
VDPEEIRVAVTEGGKLAEVFVERMWEHQRAGDIYKARVDSVLPGMNAAFVDLGEGRNAFLYLADARGMTVRQNQELLVQVSKTARKGKGARVTPRLSLPGRYLVLVPGGREIGVSRKLGEEERDRLRALAKKIRPAGMGLIVRTAAEWLETDVLQQDLEELLELWQQIEHEAKLQQAPCLLYQDMGLLGRVLRDELDESVSEIITDGKEEYLQAKTFVERFCKDGEKPEISLHQGNIPLFELYGLEQEIETALERKVWLESGAYLVIDQTEALTVIDVNTGKFTGQVALRDTVLATNLESADEIARQLRLRAIGGIVVIDFIDMENAGDQKLLLDRLQQVFRKDRCKARVFGLTQLGLVELTRKRARSDIRATFTRGCPFCGGTGVVAKEESLAVAIKRFVRKVALSSRPEAILLETHPSISRFIADNMLAQWEKETGVRLFLRDMPDFPWNKYRIEVQGTLDQVLHRIRLLETREAGCVVHRTDPA